MRTNVRGSIAAPVVLNMACSPNGVPSELAQIVWRGFSPPIITWTLAAAFFGRCGGEPLPLSCLPSQKDRLGWLAASPGTVQEVQAQLTSQLARLNGLELGSTILLIISYFLVFFLVQKLKRFLSMKCNTDPAHS